MSATPQRLDAGRDGDIWRRHLAGDSPAVLAAAYATTAVDIRRRLQRLRAHYLTEQHEQAVAIMQRAHVLRIVADQRRHASLPVLGPGEREREARAWEQQARDLEAEAAKLDAANVAGRVLVADPGRPAAGAHVSTWANRSLRIVPRGRDDAAPTRFGVS